MVNFIFGYLVDHLIHSIDTKMSFGVYPIKIDPISLYL